MDNDFIGGSSPAAEVPVADASPTPEVVSTPAVESAPAEAPASEPTPDAAPAAEVPAPAVDYTETSVPPKDYEVAYFAVLNELIDVKAKLKTAEDALANAKRMGFNMNIHPGA